MFKSTCVPNSNVRHESLKANFQQQFDRYPDSSSLLYCSVDLVDSCVRQLKRGKAAGHDELTTEHLLYAHPILTVLLTLLFNILVVYGKVPLDFGKGIIIPLVKNLEGDKTSSNNYRGITISPVLSKVCELLLMHNLELFAI